MADVVITPNMNLPAPIVGQDPGPDWATNINACLYAIDSHNHTPGQGVPLNPNSLNINSDLPMNDNNLITARSVRFFPQPAALSLGTDLGCLYEAGVDLYYNDGSGNQIRLTQGGSIVGTAGSIGGLPNGTASASYAAGTFVWQSATNTSAVMDFGSAILRNNTANSKGLTLSPPNAMGADYSLTLPNIPSVTSIMALDNAGNMSGAYTVDGATIIISSNVIQIPTNVNLPGTAQSDGLTIVTSNTNNGTNNLSVIRGVVDTTTATIVSGEGFSVVKVATGEVTVTFTTSFFDTPAVAATANINATVACVLSVNASAVTIVMESISSGQIDGQLSFIIMGTRAP